ncbi:uncharacterized protein BX663DRAFT_451384 [Cokeromyces recurvatus]|uniref:uncharacterized protein n=1 Tax=Cokeromyces recurvatus TaxID=90255 RepID=UPI00221EFC0E|nr:uncharacterized protein BX663DRAFT_451384 [Cokeromyces recurvatus]KAI7904748.1 hypothetical protein BX663DRAFT_451384 [Cokeromyces recurvatus]
MSSVPVVLSDDECLKEVYNYNSITATCNSNIYNKNNHQHDYEEEIEDDDDDTILSSHANTIFPTNSRHSTDNYSLPTSSISHVNYNRKRYKSFRKKSSVVVSQGMNFIRKMKWKSNGSDEQVNNSGDAINNHDLQLNIDHYYHQSFNQHQQQDNTPQNHVIEHKESLSVSTHNLPHIHKRDLTLLNTYAEQYTRALHAPSRFLPQNQAVFTTKSDGTILLFNDIASLCFKIDKSYIGRSILTSLLEYPFRKQITNVLNRRKRKNTNPPQKSLCSDKKGLVLVCGTIIPFIKANGVKSVATLWLKEKNTDNDDHIYIWIFEEIYETSLSVYVDSECTIRRVLGTMLKIYRYKEKEVLGKHVNCLIPSLSKQQQRCDENLETIDRLKFFGSQSSQGISIPVMLTLNRHVAMGDDDLARAVIKMTSLPSITGSMFISRTSGLVTLISPVPAKYLFGRPEAIEQKRTYAHELIPLLPTLINKIPPGATLVQHALCLELLERDPIQEPAVIYAVHRDGSQFEVEIQLKMMNNDSDRIEVLITYDRLHAMSKYEKRKNHLNESARMIQEEEKKDNNHGKEEQDENNQLQNQSKLTRNRPAMRSLRISSFGAVDENRKLFPSQTCISTNNDIKQLSPLSNNRNSTKRHHHHPLDDYVILEVLGQGTYGMAKLAFRKDDPSQKKLVIKYIIKEKIIIDSWIRDRQLGSIPMEIHILRTLQKYPHVNCCRLVTSLEDEDHYFLIMELLGTGMDLYDYIEKNKSMTEDTIRNIFYQVANAIKHLHDHCIVHRDIKDENIILDQKGQIHLIDFGCATYYRKNRKFDTFTGTLEYCAPEVLKGQPYAGPPQDIWAAGVLLFTLIYRENPFHNIDEIMEKELTVPYILSEDSLDLLKKILERDIGKRINIDQVLNHSWFRNMK